MQPTPFQVLRILADGRIRSAASLARATGASEAEVARALRAMSGLGPEIRSVRGRGYRLVAPLELLEPEWLGGRLAEAGVPVAVTVVDECTSTNAILMDAARNGAPSGSALACESQIAGRGRRGRTWVAPLGGSIAFSLLWRFGLAARDLSALPLAVGVACARGLARSGATGVGLKWPNDLVHDGAKLGGILIEISSGGPGNAAVVIGVGLNTALPGTARLALDQPVTDLATVARRRLSRNAVLATLLGELAATLGVFVRDGFEAFRAEWDALHVFRGRTAQVLVDGVAVAQGRVGGVARDGALVLETPRGVERFSAGEVSLRAVGDASHVKGPRAVQDECA